MERHVPVIVKIDQSNVHGQSIVSRRGCTDKRTAQHTGACIWFGVAIPEKFGVSESVVYPGLGFIERFTALHSVTLKVDLVITEVDTTCYDKLLLALLED